YNILTIYGRNRLLLKNRRAIITQAKGKGIQLAVETQRAMYQDWLQLIDDVKISPKQPSSGMKTEYGKLEHILSKRAESEKSYILKVVIFDEEDVEYAAAMHERYPDKAFYLQVGNPYLKGESVDNHTEKLLSRYEQLVEMTMNDQRMNNVREIGRAHV